MPVGRLRNRCALPPDYQIVYKEIQKYFFKVGPTNLLDGNLLSGIVDFFEEGVAAGKGVLELIGNDVAAFCDDLIKDSPTYANIYQESISGEPRHGRDVNTRPARPLVYHRPFQIG